MNLNKTQLSEAEMNRYSRQSRLMEVGIEGQLKLTQSHAIIFGLGGLGSPASLYLASAGIGKLTLIDFDEVDDSNLQRQIVHREANIGQRKVDSAKQNLLQLNSLIEIETIDHKIEEEDLAELLVTADVVLDCTDNFASRFALNRACRLAKKPLISAAAIRWEGQLTTYDFRQDNTPCYQCLYKEDNGQELTCAMNGVLSPVVGMLGSMQAIEAIKALLRHPTLMGKLMVVDAFSMQIRTLKLNKDHNCQACGS